MIKNRDIKKNGHGMTFSSESKNDVKKEALDLLDKEKVRKQSGNGKKKGGEMKSIDLQFSKDTKHTQLKDRWKIMNQKQVGKNAVSRKRLIQHPFPH